MLLEGEARAEAQAEAGADAGAGAGSFVYTRHMFCADILAPRLSEGCCDVFSDTVLLMKIVAVRAVEHLTSAYSLIFRADAFWRGRESDN